MGFFHPGATTGTTVCKAATAELTSHKLVPFHNVDFYLQTQSVIHYTLLTWLTEMYSVVLSYGLMISYMYTYPSTEVSNIESCTHWKI